MSRLHCGHGCCGGSVSHRVHMCVCGWGRCRGCVWFCVCLCDTVYAAHRAIFISHLCRPRKCSESWLTVIFSVSAWQRCADIHRRAARAATCRDALWKLGGEAATLPNCVGVAHMLLASSIVFQMSRTVASAVTQRRGLRWTRWIVFYCSVKKSSNSI